MDKNNPFRSPAMRACFDRAVNGYETRDANYFRADGSRNLGNSPACYFWRGFDGVKATWDASSKKMMAYAYWKAGEACRDNQH